MKIGIDCRLPYYQMGGISQYAIRLIASLGQLTAAEGHQFHLYHSRKDSKSYGPSTLNHKRHSAWTPCHHRYERWLLGAEIAPARLDLFHSPDFIPPAWGAKRRIITVHDLNFYYFPQLLTAESRRYYSDQIQWAVDEADAISADSEHTRQDLIEHLNVPPEKVRTIRLAANPIYEEPVTEEAVEAVLKQFGLPRDFVLFVGTLEPRKNIPMLLKAFHQLRAESSLDLSLVLVGRKGWLYDEIFTTIDELGLSSAVHHLPNVTNEALAALHRAASMLVMPSIYEGFGLPPLEAMHGGCPVITSNRSSLPEVVGDAGILLEPEDVDAWSGSMQRLLEDSEYRKTLIGRGHLQAAKFSWRTTALQTMQLYHDLI